MIQGYPERPTILPGDKLILHVSTDAPQFRVDFYRQSQTLDFKSSSAWLPGQNSPAGSSGQDWGWPAYPISIPSDWTSGAYIAVFVEGDANGNQISFPDTSNADGRDSKALFVVKSVEPGTNASILFKVSLNTHHAYNYSGGGSLYQTQAPSDPGDPFGEKVTMLRPGGGTGGAVTPFPPYPDLDIYNPGTSPQGFAHWEPLLIGWLERNGYQVDYCTDLDIHEDTDLHLLNSYHLLLSVGHDEYWSEEMRAHVETFIQNGGNVAFFSGNTCWWRIHYVDNNTAFVCDHGTGTDQWWKATPVARPENTLTGVSYRCAGGDWGGERTPVGYQVQHADHWVYEGTGLHNGDVFGKNEHLVGYECDGAFFDNQQDSQGFFIPTGQDQTPLNFTILGVGLLDGTGWKSLPQPPNDREKELVGSNAATMGMYTNNGTVFTAATTDWIRVLAQGKEPAVEQITRNVLNRLRDLSTIDLHLTGVTNDGKLWHTVRFANGSWQPAFADVNAQESNDPGPLYAVDCGADGGDLHIIAATNVLDVTRGGKLWHTIRFANGSWQPAFGDVKAQESNDPGHFYEDISCAAAFGILHVCGITTGDGQLWHTIRFADGTW